MKDQYEVGGISKRKMEGRIRREQKNYQNGMENTARRIVVSGVLNQYMPRVHLNTFEPICVCIINQQVWHLLLRCATKHEQCIRRMADHTLKEFEEMSKVRTPYQIQGFLVWSFLETAMHFLCFASCCSLILINFAIDFPVYWLHFGSLSSVQLSQNLLALYSSLITNLLPIRPLVPLQR